MVIYDDDDGDGRKMGGIFFKIFVSPLLIEIPPHLNCGILYLTKIFVLIFARK